LRFETLAAIVPCVLYNEMTVRLPPRSGAADLAEIIDFEMFKKLSILTRSNEDGPIWDGQMSDLPTELPGDDAEFDIGS
jgi:hypothetical protein